MIKFDAFTDGFWGDYVWIFGVWEMLGQITPIVEIPESQGSHTKLRPKRRIYKQAEILPNMDIRLKNVREREFPVII